MQDSTELAIQYIR